MPWRWIRQVRLQRCQTASTLLHENFATTQLSRGLSLCIASRYASTSRESASEVVGLSPEWAKNPNPQSPTQELTRSKFSKNARLVEDPPPSGSKVTIAGLVRSIRKQKKVAFAHIEDGSTLAAIQAVFNPETARDLHNGAYVELEGLWEKSPSAGQTHELKVESVLRVGESAVDASPIQKKSMTVDHLRLYPHLRLRLPLYSLLARVRNQVMNSVHEFYSGTYNSNAEAVHVQPPIITSSDCEGAGEVFTVSPKLQSSPHAGKEEKEQKHYFREQKYLTVSSQLHLEAYAAELGNVWTLTPAFRAEESDTGRHLAEMSMLEFEGRGITELRELVDGVQALIQYIVLRLENNRTGQELLDYYASDKRSEDQVDPNLRARWTALSEPGWLHITYADAMRALENAAHQQPDLFKQKPSFDSGLALEHERWIVNKLAKDRPAFVTHYPKEQKPFYMLPSSAQTPNNSQETVECFDLLLPYGICETVGGSLREHRLEPLIQNMREKGLLSHPAGPTETDADYPYLQAGESLGSLSWYADLRLFGSSPHGGFGLGLERLLMYLTGVTNVRDSVPFPRTYKNCIA
ncbi:asparaginyl-tRNA synthetase [Knufia obscura]|uniref:Asparaginyl-tRNA synthetase n=1 Tax=Knufia obscura TaxID=1635080 RepID=A0ABR0RP69_9EURO|nr:asparaginyl-tRNA synthetase [Knufia obscura]